MSKSVAYQKKNIWLLLQSMRILYTSCRILQIFANIEWKAIEVQKVIYVVFVKK